MKKILSTLRKAVEQYDMIADGDKIAVGVSGGKDSLVLLLALAKLREFYPKNFDVIGITLDPQFSGVQTDFSKVEQLFADNNIEYHIKRTSIGEIIFDIRKETHPCSLCARMRRGALHDMAIAHGCNKVALGHHKDDAIETFFMNLFNEARIGCFSPNTYMSRKDISVIRPLCLTYENEIIATAKRNELPIVKSKCPVDGCTQRTKTKEYIKEHVNADKHFKTKIFGALQRSGIDGW